MLSINEFWSRSTSTTKAQRGQGNKFDYLITPSHSVPRIPTILKYAHLHCECTKHMIMATFHSPDMSSPALVEPADDRMVRQAEIPSLRRTNERERRVSQRCTASSQFGLRKSSALIGIRKSSTQFPPHISFIVITITVLPFVTVRGRVLHPNLQGDTSPR